MVILFPKRTHQHHLRLSEKGDNLDKDERGGDEENMTDMLDFLLLRLLRVLIALCRRRRGTISPPSDSYHPPHLCLSP